MNDALTYAQQAETFWQSADEFSSPNVRKSQTRLFRAVDEERLFRESEMSH
jgi:hypothetical protein